MKFPSLKTIIKFVTLSFCLLFLVGFVLFIYEFPQSSASIAVTKLAYNLPLDKKFFLEFYSPRGRGVNAGNVPGEFAGFLCEKLEETTDESEISAIVNFYAIQPEALRLKMSEPTKQKVMDQLIKSLGNNSNLQTKLILLEQVRSGKDLGKGTIRRKFSAKEDLSSREEWDNWWKKALPAAKEKFQIWWNLNLSWEEKKKINPLEGTEVSIEECCG